MRRPVVTSGGRVGEAHGMHRLSPVAPRCFFQTAVVDRLLCWYPNKGRFTLLGYVSFFIRNIRFPCCTHDVLGATQSGVYDGDQANVGSGRVVVLFAVSVDQAVRWSIDPQHPGWTNASDRYRAI